MKYIRLMLILSALFTLGACSSGKGKLSPEVADAFADNGRVADSLMSVFQCEGVTLDKWKGSDVTDATFSFCLINSGKLPTRDMVLKNNILKEIARSIKNSIKAPHRYNSFQIVFVKSEKMFWFGGKTQYHSMGEVVSGRDL